ncbi:MAG: carbon-nitrogen hydrolase [Gemmatales bacterium]|nr:carbon-nitrogen hydrolase [Gemmatales bacterium]MDW8387142.1 carbon-nitrogen hydrolase [Gemmatales bacterium]
MLKLGLIQMRCGNDPSENLTRALSLCRQAAQRGANVLCLPELFRTQYFCQTEDPALFDLAEPIPGPTTEALSRLAAETGAVVVGSVFERRMAGVYHNSVAVLDADGKLLGLYRKMHIPDDPLYYEKFYFTPGDLGFRVFATRFGRIGTLICWDQWFPEAARLTALQGAEVLVYPTAIGWHPREKAEHGQAQHQAWETVQRGHAIANGVFVAAVNRVGHEGPKDGGLEFWGASFVSDPFGRLLHRCSHDCEEVAVVACDRQLIEETRRNWPFFRDRRIDAYAPLLERALKDSSA